MPVRVLLVTDLTYRARGRRYGDEDVALAAALRAHVTVAMCHPLDAEALAPDFDVVLVRNTGPVIHYLEAYERFRGWAQESGTTVLPQLSGRADQVGKDYLLELFAAGYPVIPTVDDLDHLDRLDRIPRIDRPAASDRFVVKPRLGADSVGLQFLDRDELADADLTGMLVQPAVPFVHEVSFYFVDRTFHYALHAPDPDVRWALQPFEPTPEDLAFAQRFVDWNDLDHGIQRVDACRTADGALLLVELEDWNPYLSLDVLDAARRETFVDAVVASIRSVAG